jgi:hypothetical protein
MPGNVGHSKLKTQNPKLKSKTGRAASAPVFS